jgi:hypothetical protein
MADKIDANVVGFAMAEEVSPKVLPANPRWYLREPNSFDDLGGDLTMVARRPFNPSRQRKKGSVVDLDADGGFNEDLTQNNMQEPLQGFFFADLRKKGEVANIVTLLSNATAFTAAAGTDQATMNGHGLATGDGPFTVVSDDTLPVPLAAATPYWVIVTGANTFKFATSYANAVATVPVPIDLTTNGIGALTMARVPVVTAADDAFNVPDTSAFIAGALVKATGFVAANNGVHVVSAVSDGKIEVDTVLTEEDAPGALAKLEVVGFEFAEDDVELEVRVGSFALISATQDMRELNLIPGEWVFIGGDQAANRLDDNAPGYARVASEPTETEIVFDKSTFTPANNDGVGTTLRIYTGTVLRNEDDPDLIVRRTYHQERTLGRDADGIQAEYLEGAVANEMTWNSPLANLVNIDLGYMAMDNTHRNGAEGRKSAEAGAVIVKALGEDAFNTSSNVYRLRLNPTPLFARVTEWTLTVNNNVTANKAQGVLGAFDMTAGGFDVGGEFTAYFSTVEAVRAIRDNADVTFDAIYAKKNAAVIIDVPLLGLGGGKLEVEQDAPIMVPLENSAAESPMGHTLLLTWLPYVPSVGMASN